MLNRFKNIQLQFLLIFIIIVSSFSVLSLDKGQTNIINTEIVSNILCYQESDFLLGCNMYFLSENNQVIKETSNKQIINLKLLTAYQDFSIKNKEELGITSSKKVIEVVKSLDIVKGVKKENNANKENNIDEKIKEVSLALKTEEETTNKPTTHYVDITKKGFVPDKLTINVGDAVVWKQTRAGNLKQAVVQGTRNYIDIESPIMYKGEQFQNTFNEQGKFIYVDTISIYQVGEIIIE